MAIAPTATISYIAGCSQSIEPDFSLLYVYSTLSGEFTQINKYFVAEMKKRGLWCEDLIQALKITGGSIQNTNLPDDIKERFKGAFELDQRKLIECAAARQKWIDMGQSLNLYANTDSLKALHDMYVLAWELGLKTTYYLRTKGASSVEKVSTENNTCSIEAMKRGEVCESCQ